MKKLNLNASALQGVMLTRSELKKLLGGLASPAETCNCNNKSDCPTSDPKKPQDCLSDCTAGSSGYAGHCGWDGTSGEI